MACSSPSRARSCSTSATLSGGGHRAGVGDPLRGPYLSWLAWYAGVVEPVVTLGFAGLADNPHVQRSFRGPAEIGARVLAALRAGPYLLGERFSGVDVLFASLAQWARTRCRRIRPSTPGSRA